MQQLTVSRIVVIGPESTGKSTLSKALATVLNYGHVPEYARAYLEGLGRSYVESDLLAIAAGQLALENAAMSIHARIVCDTDLHVVRVWSEHSYGQCHRRILEWIAARRYDAYLLTDIDMPWEDDPLREHPAPEERRYFFEIYKDTVIQSGLPWLQVSGDEDQRLKTALRFLASL